MIFPCKVWPTPDPQHALPGQKFHWAAFLPTKLMYRHESTKTFEAWIDSGAPYCMFRSDFCRPLGIKLTDGVQKSLGGIIGGDTAPIYIHKVTLVIGGEQFGAMAGFSDALAVGAILGRAGFFENFKVLFDAETNPPHVELTKIHRI